VLTRLTQEYLAGILVGIGVSAGTARLWFPEILKTNDLLLFGGLACVIGGSVWAGAVQRKRAKEDQADKAA
jgi:hypothetical protein